MDKIIQITQVGQLSIPGLNFIEVNYLGVRNLAIEIQFTFIIFCSYSGTTEITLLNPHIHGAFNSTCYQD